MSVISGLGKQEYTRFSRLGEFGLAIFDRKKKKKVMYFTGKKTEAQMASRNLCSQEVTRQGSELRKPSPNVSADSY